MSDAKELARIGRRLNHDAGAPAIPSLFFLTDPVRTPDPARDAAGLPRGAAIVFRHFGGDRRFETARRLAAIARRRGLILLIAADPDLARRVGAHGVHWPQTRAPPTRQASGILETMSAHGPQGLEMAARLGVDAAILGPVFPTQSASGNPPLGLFCASQMARRSPIPVIALGGISTLTARRLTGRGFAGLAAVQALSANSEKD